MIKWWIRTFKVISKEKALQMGLTAVENVHGDMINCLNCRSIWKDTKGKTYLIKSLI